MQCSYKGRKVQPLNEKPKGRLFVDREVLCFVSRPYAVVDLGSRYGRSDAEAPTSRISARLPVSLFLSPAYIISRSQLPFARMSRSAIISLCVNPLDAWSYTVATSILLGYLERPHPPVKEVLKSSQSHWTVGLPSGLPPHTPQDGELIIGDFFKALPIPSNDQIDQTESPTDG